MYNQGDLLLIPVPFSDLSSEKRLRERAYTVPLDQNDLCDGVLPKPSCVRADKLYTLAQSIVIKRVGRVGEAKRAHVHKAVEDLLTP